MENLEKSWTSFKDTVHRVYRREQPEGLALKSSETQTNNYINQMTAVEEDRS